MVIIVLTLILLSMIGYYVYPQIDAGKKLNVFERMWLGVDFNEEELVTHAVNQVFDILPGLEKMNPDLLDPNNIKKTEITYIDARSNKDDGLMVNVVVDIYLYEPSDAEHRSISVNILTWNNWVTSLSTGLMDYYDIER